MNKRIERALERRLRKGGHHAGDPEVPRRRTDRASELGTLLGLARSVSRSYADVPEPPAGLAQGRQQLLSTAARLRQQASSREPLPREARGLERKRKGRMTSTVLPKLAGATLAAMLITLVVGGGVAAAAGNSLPGETLYPVKLAVEDARLALASSPEAEAELAMEFVRERTQEMEMLMEQGDEIPDEVVARMNKHLNRAMNQAAWTSEQEMPGLLQRMTTRLQEQEDALEQLQLKAQEQRKNQTQLQTAQQACDQAQEQASEGLADPQTYRERHQDREGQPDEANPPEAPSNEPSPGDDGQGNGGPGNGKAGQGSGGR
jgi:hypothetical protein